MKTHTHIIMSLLATFFVVRMLPDVVADEAEDLIVIQQVDCNKPVFLSKQLILEFAEPNAVAWLMEKNGSLLADMTMILKETYSELSFYSCDSPLFRQIHNISVLDNDSDINGSGAPNNKNHYGDETLTFKLEMSCHNCTDDQPLFEVPVIPLNESITNATTTNTTTNATFFQTYMEFVTTKKQTKRQGNHSAHYYCICPSNHDIYPASLTAEDFVLLANEKLMAQQMNITITHSMELEEISCSSIVRQFTSRVYMDMDFSGNTFSSIEEVRSMEESLMQTYNRLSFESCDQYHRKINRVKLGFRLDTEDFLEEVDMPPTWQNTNATMASNNLSLWWNTTSWNTTYPWWDTTNWNSTSNESSTLDVLPNRHILKAVFTVDAECRNCSVNSAGWFTLFHNGAGLQLPTGEEHMNASGNPDIEEISLNEKARSNLRNARSSTWQKSLPTAWQDPTNTTTCVCPVKQEPDMTLTNHTRDPQSSGPSSSILTEESILHFYNTKIEQGREEGLIEMVKSVSNLEEVQVINCGPNISLFNSQVFAGIRVDPTTITSQQIRKMEKAVKDTYNDLAFRSCDGLFRAITEAELVFYHTSTNSSNGMADEIYQYQNSSSNFHKSRTYNILNNRSTSQNNTNSSDGIFVANNDSGVNSADDVRREYVATMFSIKGECRGCGVSSSGTFNLFDDAFGGGRRLQANKLANESLPHPNKHTGGSKEDPSTCVCLAGVELSTTGEGPTSEVFAEALTKEIALLDQNEEIESVEATVGAVLEGMQVSCTGDVKDFTSYVYSELEIGNGPANDEAREKMERVFVETYNSLSFQACDEFFRVVGEVKLMISDDLKPALYNLNGTRAPGMAATHFEVTGHCRNCDVTNGHFNLFDDAFGGNPKVLNRGTDKRNQKSIPNSNPMPSSGNRASEALGFCLCPHGKQPGEDPPPSKERFLSEFNRNFFQDQKEKGSPEEENTEQVGETPILFIEEVVPPSRGGAPIPFASPTVVSPDSQPTFEPTPASSSNLALSGDLTFLRPTFSPTVGKTDLDQHGSSTLRPYPQPTFEPTPHSTPGLSPSGKMTLRPSPQEIFSPTASPTNFSQDGSAGLPPFPQPTFEPTPESTQDDTPQQGLLMRPTTPQPQPTSQNPNRQPTSQPTREPTDRWTNLVAEPTPAPMLTLTVTLPPIPRPSPEQSPSPVLTLTVTLPPNPRTSPKPTSQPSPRPTPQPTPCPTPIPTQRPTPSPTPEPTPQRVPQPSPNPTPDPTRNPTPIPTFNPTQRPTASPTQRPTPEPTPNPTSVPPTPTPTKEPTPEPTPDPTYKPSGCPTSLPSSVPSSPYPSVPPSKASSQSPSVPPSKLPSLGPSSSPTISAEPSVVPSENLSTSSASPSFLSSLILSTAPSFQPSSSVTPSLLPSTKPSDIPTKSPSLSPSQIPSSAPTPLPSISLSHSQTPSLHPSRAPSFIPSIQPSESSDPSSQPSHLLGAAPSTVPSGELSPPPTLSPQGTPSLFPSVWGSESPSGEMSSSPSQNTSGDPSSSPSSAPSIEPSSGPSASSSQSPPVTLPPASNPTATLPPIFVKQPSLLPNSIPSLEASFEPSHSPSNKVSSAPTIIAEPSGAPSVATRKRPSSSPSGHPKADPSNFPTQFPSHGPSPSPSPNTSSSGVPSFHPTSTPPPSSMLPSDIPVGSPSDPSMSPSSVPSGLPSDAPSQLLTNPSGPPSTTPGETPSRMPSVQPPQLPSQLPSTLPSVDPSSTPSASSSGVPSSSVFPSDVPSTFPSDLPTNIFSAAPSHPPTSNPSGSLSTTPSAKPSGMPSYLPSHLPSQIPSNIPSTFPSMTPSKLPSSQPSRKASAAPSGVPSRLPSPVPSVNPSSSMSPSNVPSGLPSKSPTQQPSTSPSSAPSESPSASLL